MLVIGISFCGHGPTRTLIRGAIVLERLTTKIQTAPVSTKLTLHLRPLLTVNNYVIACPWSLRLPTTKFIRIFWRLNIGPTIPKVHVLWSCIYLLFSLRACGTNRPTTRIQIKNILCLWKVVGLKLMRKRSLIRLGWLI